MTIEDYEELRPQELYTFNCSVCNTPVTGKKSYSKKEQLKQKRLVCRKCGFHLSCIDKYGVPYVPMSEDAYLKKKKTLQEHFGVDNPMKCEAIRKKAEETNQERYGVSNIFQDTEKIKAAIREKFNVENVSQLEDIKQKKKATYEAHYGVEHPMYSEQVKQKLKETNMLRYGHENTFQVEEFKNKIRETNQKNLGVDYPMQSEVCLEKAIETYYKKYGVHHPIISKYKYNGLYFDSSWELAFYIYNIDNNIEIEREPIKISYEYENRTHYYRPDFRIGEQLYEVKGDYFFNENNELINPYSEEENGLYLAKQKCMEYNNVIILKSAEISEYLSYIDNRYGVGYLRNFVNILDRDK